MIKIYTHNAIFRHIAKIMPAAEFSKIQTYLAAVMLGTEKYSLKYSYKTYNKPIYRGLNPNKRFSINDYPLNSIGQWPLFQSATTDVRVAHRFSWMNQANSKPSSWAGKILIFKIFCCSSNSPPG